MMSEEASNANLDLMLNSRRDNLRLSCLSSNPIPYLNQGMQDARFKRSTFSWPGEDAEWYDENGESLLILRDSAECNIPVDGVGHLFHPTGIMRVKVCTIQYSGFCYGCLLCCYVWLLCCRLSPNHLHLLTQSPAGFQITREGL